jgi:O-methyltransferase involved in polyketide biosynthesis
MPEQVEAFLGEYGWRLVEHLGTSELLTRYVGPARRDLDVMAIERIVLAEKS